MNQSFQTRNSDCAGSFAGFGGGSILYQERNNYESIASYPGPWVRKIRYIKGKTTSADDTFDFAASKRLSFFSGVKLCQLFHLEQPYSQSLSTYHP